MKDPHLKYIVICVSSVQEGGTGGYELATRSVFDSAGDASAYATGIAASRLPLVVPGRWTELRFDGSERVAQVGRVHR